MPGGRVRTGIHVRWGIIARQTGFVLRGAGPCATTATVARWTAVIRSPAARRWRSATARSVTMGACAPKVMPAAPERALPELRSCATMTVRATAWRCNVRRPAASASCWWSWRRGRGVRTAMRVRTEMNATVRGSAWRAVRWSARRSIPARSRGATSLLRKVAIPASRAGRPLEWAATTAIPARILTSVSRMMTASWNAWAMPWIAMITTPAPRIRAMAMWGASSHHCLTTRFA